MYISASNFCEVSMRRSKRRLKSNFENKGDLNYQYIDNPFSSIPRSDLTAVLDRISKDSIEKLNTSLEKVYKYEPSTLLATVTYYSTLQTLGESGIEAVNKSNLSQANAELFQAFILSMPKKDLGSEFANSAIIEESLAIIADLLQSYRYKSINANASDLLIQHHTGL